jgi:hypothetical protein
MTGIMQIAEISHALIRPSYPIIRYHGPVKGKILVLQKLLGGASAGRDTRPGTPSLIWMVSVSGNWRVVFEFDGPDATDIDLVDYH